MFKRRSKQEVVAKVAQEVTGAVPMDVAVVQRMMGEFLASTALARVQSDVGAIARDFAEFKGNIAKLNSSLGEFRENAIVPVLKELEYLRYNMGARTDDTAAALSKLVHHLQDQLELLLKTRGVDPNARDVAGESALDRLGVARDRPSLNELETSGVKAPMDTGNLQIDTAAELQRRIEAQAAELTQLRHENAELRRLAVEDGLEGA
jgi:hypothetical protein